MFNFVLFFNLYSWALNMALFFYLNSHLVKHGCLLLTVEWITSDRTTNMNYDLFEIN